MNQSCCSLGFISQNSLWKLFTFHGYKGIYSKVWERMWKVIFFAKQGALVSDLRLGWVVSSNRQLIEWPYCIFFFFFFFCSVVIYLSWHFNFLHAPHVWHFWRVTTHESVARVLLMHTLDQIFTLSHTQPLHNSHLNIGFLIAKLQANLVWNKASAWLNKFNLTIFPFGYSMTKP